MMHEFSNFESFLGEGLRCPSCAAHKIPIPPTGALTVSKCDQCGQIVAQFIHIAVKVDANIMRFGSEDDKKRHIVDALSTEVTTRFREKLEEQLFGKMKTKGNRQDSELDLMLKLPYVHTSVREIEDHYINLSLRLTDMTRKGEERPASLINEFHLYKTVYEKLRKLESENEPK